MQSSIRSEIHSVIPDTLSLETECSGTSFCCNYIVWYFHTDQCYAKWLSLIRAGSDAASGVRSELATESSDLSLKWEFGIMALINSFPFLLTLSWKHISFHSPWMIRLLQTIDHINAEKDQVGIAGTAEQTGGIRLSFTLRHAP